MNFFPGAKVVSEGDWTKIKLDNIGQVEVPPLYMERGRARQRGKTSPLV